MSSVLTKNQDINDPEYFKCCCGVHVKQGALVIAIIIIVLGVLQLFSGIVGNILSAKSIISIVVIVACALVVYADRQEKAWAYIPLLVFKALGIIGILVGIFLTLIWGITLPQWLIDTLTEEGTKQRTWTRDEVRIACFTYMVILIIGEAVEIWLWTIVFRAYRYMREILGGPSLDDTKGALTIAIIGIVGGFLELFSGNVGSTLSGIVLIATGSLVIYADRKEKAWAYIPFLVVQALVIIGTLVDIFLLLVRGITLLQWLIDTFTKQGTEQRTLTPDEVRAACFIAVILIIAVAVEIWFWSIVFRAYRYMREVLGKPSLGNN